MDPSLPILEPLAWVDPGDAFRCLAGGHRPPRGIVFLDSAGPVRDLSRWSILAADSFDVIEDPADPFGAIESALADHRAEPGTVPFAGGGAIGLLGYGLRHHLERLPRRHPAASEPDLWLGLYDALAIFDRGTRRAWIASTGLPERRDRAARARRAVARAAWLRSLLAPAAGSRPDRAGGDPDPAPLPSRDTLPPGARVSMTPAAWSCAVEQARSLIRAGDIYQANLSYRVEVPCPLAPPDLYRRLRAISPAPFGAYLDPGPFQVLCNSPERFLLHERGRIETRPIKGTRPRRADPDEDRREAQALLASEKDRAEHLMIVDLERSDLGRVARPGSVHVERLAALERYANVHHLVSVVSAELRPGAGPVDALRACFPGGSITGAPKIRAMEVIEALEEGPRGVYTGAVGGIDFSGRMDLSIAIRTAILRDGVASFHVGGGIVADSKPDLEYLETVTKAEALCRALTVP